MIKTLKRWAPLFIWMAIMFYFSNQPTIQAAKFDWLDFIIKKTAHLGEYAILYLLTARAFSSPARHLNAFIFCLIFAFSDEIHQMFIPGRTARLRDILVFDAIGSLIGVYLLKQNKLVKKWLNR